MLLTRELSRINGRIKRSGVLLLHYVDLTDYFRYLLPPLGRAKGHQRSTTYLSFDLFPRSMEEGKLYVTNRLLEWSVGWLLRTVFYIYKLLNYCNTFMCGDHITIVRTPRHRRLREILRNTTRTFCLACKPKPVVLVRNPRLGV